MSLKQCVAFLMMIAIGVATPTFSYAWGIGKETCSTKDGKELCVFELFHDGVTYAVFAVAGGECSGSADFDTGESTGHLRSSPARDDRPVEIKWSCDTADGVNGTVTIGEEKFELAKGKVFHVVLDGEKPQIDQLAADMAKYDEGNTVDERLSALAKTARRISPFADAWRESAKAEQSNAADSR